MQSFRHSLLLAVLFAAPVLAQQPDYAAQRDAMVESITVEEIRSHVEFLAGPTTHGRATLSPGFDLAAEYVEQHLKEWGIAPAGEEGSYRLPVGLRCVAPSSQAMIEVARGKEVQRLTLGVDFVPVPGAGSAKVSGEPVFLGFAIDASKEKWREEDRLKGKIAFAFTREPFADDPKSKRFDGIEPTEYSSWRSKARMAADAGAVGLVLIPDPGEFAEEVGPVPHLVPQPLFPGMQVRGLRRMTGLPDFPIMSMSRKAASELFEEDLDTYYESILKRKKPKELEPKKVTVTLRNEVEEAVIPSYNLAAWVRGSGETGKTVVIGAHLDHVGYNHWMDQGYTRVHPGADDNASGSAALLEIAQALSMHPPVDDVLLLWFTAEEYGLHGSRAYCDKPLVPHEQTTIMLNMDQIARTDQKSMNLGGLWEQPNLEKLSKQVGRDIGQKLKLDFKGGRDLFQRSDHYSFYQKGVPVIFFFEGDINSNPVYHKPGDVHEDIDFTKTMWVARQVLATAWAFAAEGETL